MHFLLIRLVPLFSSNLLQALFYIACINKIRMSSRVCDNRIASCLIMLSLGHSLFVRCNVDMAGAGVVGGARSANDTVALL